MAGPSQGSGLRTVAGVAAAQRLTREVVHEISAKIRPGDREIDIARQADERLTRLGVRKWLHTPYAWWGERTRFGGFHSWEPSALPTARKLQEGEAFILDAAPLVGGYPADYAISGVAGDGPAAAVNARLREALDAVKSGIVEWAKSAETGASLFQTVTGDVVARGLAAIHPLYPAGVLGHSFDSFPSLFGRMPRLGDGFQAPLLASYGFAIAKHYLTGAPYPFINANSISRPRGLYAVEPHVAIGDVGAKFESILFIDGDETRWLDPGLYGEVQG